MKKKQIPIKNYIILGCLFVGTILLLLFVTEKYEQYVDYQKQTPIIEGTFTNNIRYEEIEHYITENPTSVLYMCTASNEVCRSYEKELKKLIIKEGLSNSITYLNLSDVDPYQFVMEFNSRYHYKKELTTSYPAFVILKDNEVVDILQGSEEKALTIEKTKAFLKYYEVGEDDE